MHDTKLFCDESLRNNDHWEDNLTFCVILIRNLDKKMLIIAASWKTAMLVTIFKWLYTNLRTGMHHQCMIWSLLTWECENQMNNSKYVSCYSYQLSEFTSSQIIIHYRLLKMIFKYLYWTTEFFFCSKR